MGEFRGTDRFEVVRRIGAGGMGVVYEVRDRREGGRVALKTLRKVEPQAIYRFKHEFRALQGIQHPNLVDLGELVEDSGEWFFTMELVDGVDLVRYVREGDRCDERRLRATLRQLAAGLFELHAAGKVHRDIKPSNILVARDERVVLLDFGLLTEVADPDGSTQANVVGTAAYMAPEQAASKPVGPPADWYALGVVLYEALTGRLPFSGAALEILMDKQTHEPPPPRTHVPDAPADLDALCVELLRFDPEARPAGRKILRRLGADADLPTARGSSSQATNAPPFVGRERELAALRDAYARTEEGAPVGVVVRGESGVGKSSLIRQFAEAVVAEAPSAVVLAGRCYERENVPYKGFDGVIDALSHYMRRIDEREAAALVPRYAGLLPRLFPVLGRVEAIARAPTPATAAPDPQRLRARVFQALRELLSRLAERHPLILVIDDLQWADSESLLLLSELVRAPDPPPLLLLASSRVPISLPCDCSELELAALEPAVARRLAQLLLERARLADSVSPSAIASEALGHPLFIDELVRHAQMTGDREQRHLRLDEAIWGRVETLPGPARAILELVVVAGAPLTRQVVRDAARVSAADLARHASLLRVANLIRGRGARASDSIEPYHDRVREAVLDKLDAATRRECHARLAFALEASGAANDRPELLLRHFEGAGQRDRAAACAEQAARRATIALAFDRAASLYRSAIRLGDEQGARRRELMIALGDTLACAGRGLEAADAYVEAAEGAEAGVRLDCKRKATEHLLKTGHAARGLEAMHDLFGELGVRLPRSPRATLTAVVINRARLRLRGYRWRARDESEIAPRDLILADVLHGVARGLALVDFVRSAQLGTRALLLALKLGERRRVLKELAFEAMSQATAGGKELRRGKRLLERIRGELEGDDDGYHHALALAADGIIDFYEGRFERAIERVGEAQSILIEQTAATAWEVNALRLFEVFALRRAGQVRALAARADRYIHDAELRQDPFTATSIRCNSSLMWLGADRPDRAREALDVGRWENVSGRLDLQQWWGLLSRVELNLYEGDDPDPQATFRAEFAELDRSLLARALLPVAMESSFVWARAVLAGRSSDLRAARRSIRRLAREPFPHARAWVCALEAGCAMRAGDRERAERGLRDAIDHAELAGMRLEVAAYGMYLGRLIGGREGERLAERADATMRGEGIVAPERIARMVAPGFAAGNQP